MAHRIEAAACLIFAAFVSATELKVPVRHVHMRRGGEGVLTFDDKGVAFAESGKKAAHSHTWAYNEIQRIELTRASLRIQSYEDIRWQLGRDREYRFDRVPDEMTARLYTFLATRLDQRFIARIPDPNVDRLWSVPAKMLNGTSGSNGTLTVGSDRIVFESSKDSRTWRYRDIQSITTESPFELTLCSLDGETRVQLKQPIAEERYNELWRRISEANGLKTFHSSLENHHD